MEGWSQLDALCNANSKSRRRVSSSHNPLTDHRFGSRMVLLPKIGSHLAGLRASTLESRSIGLEPDTRLTRNITTSTRVCLSEALVRNAEWSHSMTKSKILGLAAILSVAIATPVLAAGETTTRPWSAPVGHRQPRVADVPASASLQTLDQEDANVDRKISNVCRGC